MWEMIRGFSLSQNLYEFNIFFPFFKQWCLPTVPKVPIIMELMVSSSSLATPISPFVHLIIASWWHCMPISMHSDSLFLSRSPMVFSLCLFASSTVSWRLAAHERRIRLLWLQCRYRLYGRVQWWLWATLSSAARAPSGRSHLQQRAYVLRVRTTRHQGCSYLCLWIINLPWYHKQNHVHMSTHICCLHIKVRP